LNQGDRDGQTAAHWAVLLDEAPLLKHLLQAGAVLSVKDAGGNTPVHLAARENNRACLEVMHTLCPRPKLIQAWGLVNHADQNALQVAEACGSLDALHCLATAGLCQDFSWHLSRSELEALDAQLREALASLPPETVPPQSLGPDMTLLGVQLPDSFLNEPGQDWLSGDSLLAESPEAPSSPLSEASGLSSAASSEEARQRRQRNKAWTDDMRAKNRHYCRQRREREKQRHQGLHGEVEMLEQEQHALLHVIQKLKEDRHALLRVTSTC
jgi:ankyrin repeat protein